MIKLTDKEMKSLDLEFRTKASRMFHAKWQEAHHQLNKFVEFTEQTEVLCEYVHRCDLGMPSDKMDEMIDNVARGFGEVVFDFGNTSQVEIARSYYVMKVVAAKQEQDLLFAIGRAYDGDSKYQSSVEGFVHAVVRPFVDGINLYLHTIAMNTRDDTVKTITINNTGSNAQINISNDKSSIVATQNNNGIDIKDLDSLSAYLRSIDIPESDIDDLKKIISTDGPTAKDNLGVSTNRWIAKVMTKIADGIVALPMETAAAVLATAICKAIGLG